MTTFGRHRPISSIKICRALENHFGWYWVSQKTTQGEPKKVFWDFPPKHNRIASDKIGKYKENKKEGEKTKQKERSWLVYLSSSHILFLAPSQRTSDFSQLFSSTDFSLLWLLYLLIILVIHHVLLFAARIVLLALHIEIRLHSNIYLRMTPSCNTPSLCCLSNGRVFLLVLAVSTLLELMKKALFHLRKVAP